MNKINFDKQTIHYTEKLSWYDGLPKHLKIVFWIVLTIYFGGGMIAPIF